MKAFAINQPEWHKRVTMQRARFMTKILKINKFDGRVSPGGRLHMFVNNFYELFSENFYERFFFITFQISICCSLFESIAKSSFCHFINRLSVLSRVESKLSIRSFFFHSSASL